MSKVLKESLSNINREDTSKNLQNNHKDSGSLFNRGSKNSQSNNSTSETLLNQWDSSLLQKEENKNKINLINDDDLENREYEVNSYITDSNHSDLPNYINFFSLPKFGL
jgi:hypothetical protein